MNWFSLQIPAHTERRQQREWLNTTKWEATGCTEVMQDLVWISNWKTDTTYYLKIICKKICVRIQVLSFLSFHGCFSLLELPWLQYEAMEDKLKNSRCFLTESRRKCERKTKNHIVCSYVHATLTVITGLYPHNILKSEGTPLFFKRMVEQIM